MINHVLDYIEGVNDFVIYYPGMGIDVYKPFAELNATKVIAVDKCPYELAYDIKTVDNKYLDNEYRLYKLSDYLVAELTNIFKPGDYIETVTMKSNGEYYLKIDFYLDGKRRNLEYYYFRDIYDFVPDYNADLIMTCGTKICWFSFTQKAKIYWAEYDIPIISDNIIMDEFSVLQYLKLGSGYENKTKRLLKTIFKNSSNADLAKLENKEFKKDNSYIIIGMDETFLNNKVYDRISKFIID